MDGVFIFSLYLIVSIDSIIKVSKVSIVTSVNNFYLYKSTQ